MPRHLLDPPLFQLFMLSGEPKTDHLILISIYLSSGILPEQRLITRFTSKRLCVLVHHGQPDGETGALALGGFHA